MRKQDFRRTTARVAVILLVTFASVLCLASLAAFIEPAEARESTWTSRAASYSEHILGHRRAGLSSSFHYLVPATSSNVHLCRLLASAVATGFPPPTLLMWGDNEDADEYKTHMAKVDAILSYLRSHTPDRDNDLVLIVDGFDVWHQLPLDVMITRYQAAVTAADRHFQQKMGPLQASLSNIKNTVFFGPDKICWPEDPSRAACWAVPDSPLPRWAFGPETDSGAWRNTNRPRWLNSGTIIGPLRDVRKVFEAIKASIEFNRTVDSDQFYFSNLWGRQEYLRRASLGEDFEEATTVSVPQDWRGSGSLQRVIRQIPPGRNSGRWEYHMALDHMSSMFQTAAYYADFLTWTRYSNPSEAQESSMQEADYNPIPHDIASASRPLAQALPAASAEQDLSWSNLPLGTNTASGEVFGLIHFTPPKSLRDKWWSRMWYFPFLEEIIRNGVQPNENNSILTDKSGVDWKVYSPPTAVPGSEIYGLALKGGIWSEIPWTEACRPYETGVLGASDQPEPLVQAPPIDGLSYNQATAVPKSD